MASRTSPKLSVILRLLLGGDGSFCTSSGCRIALPTMRWAALHEDYSINTRRGVHFVKGSTLELGPPASAAPSAVVRLKR
jgi:hypothetical protein